MKKYPDRHRKVPSRKVGPRLLNAFEFVHLIGNHSSKGSGVPRLFPSRPTTRPRRSACAVSLVGFHNGGDPLTGFRFSDRSQHSHEIGIANLPFTRRGRRAQVEQEKARSARRRSDVESSRASTSAPASGTPAAVQQLEEPNLPSIAPEIQDPPTEQTIDPVLFAHDPTTQFTPLTNQQTVHQMTPTPAPPPPQPQSQQMMPPPPPQSTTLTQIAQIHHSQSLVQDEQARWDRMSVLFEHVRNAARTYEHAPPSVAALESVLVRMYLESPLNGTGHMARPSN